MRPLARAITSSAVVALVLASGLSHGAPEAGAIGPGKPQLYLSPARGPVGTVVEAYGCCFLPSEAVAWTFAGEPLPVEGDRDRAQADGSLDGRFWVPFTSEWGVKEVLVTASSGRTMRASFEVTGAWPEGSTTTEPPYRLDSTTTTTGSDGYDGPEIAVDPDDATTTGSRGGPPAFRVATPAPTSSETPPSAGGSAGSPRPGTSGERPPDDVGEGHGHDDAAVDVPDRQEMELRSPSPADRGSSGWGNGGLMIAGLLVGCAVIAILLSRALARRVSRLG